MKCVIAGGNGLVGSELLQLLIANPLFQKVTAIVRRPLSLANTKIDQIVVDWDHAFAVPSADVAFCCLGTTIKKAGSAEAFAKVDHGYVLEFARASLKAGVKTFIIVTAVGSDANSKLLYSRVKGEAENDLNKIGFSSLVILRPSLLLGERTESRPLERAAIVLYPFYRPLLLGPLAKHMPIPARRVAEVMVEKALTATPGLDVIENAAMLRPTS